MLRITLLRLRGAREVIKARILMLKGVTGKFSQNPPLRLRGAREVMKERPLILRWNLWRN